MFPDADDDGVVDTYVHYLRRKLGRPSVLTVRGNRLPAGQVSMKRRWFETERGNDADPRRAARRLAVQFTALIVVLLSLAGVVVYYLAAAGAEQALQDRLDSAAALNNPRDAPLDIFLAVYDRGRLSVSRDMPAGLPVE